MPEDLNEFFFRLSPERVLQAVAAAGHEPSGHCFALNALENRVYDVRLEDGAHVVAKFYRPGRWSREALQEEHDRALVVSALREVLDERRGAIARGGTAADADGVESILAAIPLFYYQKAGYLNLPIWLIPFWGTLGLSLRRLFQITRAPAPPATGSIIRPPPGSACPAPGRR